MKRFFLLICFFLPLTIVVSGNEFMETSCAPVKNGKVCYSSDISFTKISQDRLFETINQWAVKNYGTDVFYSNVSSNKGRGSILVSSKIELLLDEKDKTFLKFKMRIQCYENRYTVDITDIVYQYDPDNNKRLKSYPAENVIINEGEGNKVPAVTNPLLFCQATAFFADGLLAEIKELFVSRK